jgi:hypothetical protein
MAPNYPARNHVVELGQLCPAVWRSCEAHVGAAPGEALEPFSMGAWRMRAGPFAFGSGRLRWQHPAGTELIRRHSNGRVPGDID